MFWAFDITITAGTTDASPKKQTLKLSKGVITGLDVKYPAGCHRMVKVRLFRYESQLVPLSRDDWLTGDDETVHTEGYYELTETPTQLKFVGCSPGTSYDHTVSVRITVLPKAIASMLPLVNVLTAFLKRIGVIR